MELAVCLLNLREHLIERVGEEVKFIGSGAMRPDGVVMPLRHRAGSVRQRQYGLQQLMLQAS